MGRVEALEGEKNSRLNQMRRDYDSRISDWENQRREAECQKLEKMKNGENYQEEWSKEYMSKVGKNREALWQKEAEEKVSKYYDDQIAEAKEEESCENSWF